MRYARIQSATGPLLCRVDDDGGTHPLRFADTGVAVTRLQQVIAAGPSAAGRLVADEAVATGRLLAPVVPDRNVFCVGRNYSDHAAEFAKSGFDSGSTADDHLPAHPVVFTKPAATVIASGDRVDPHTDLTSAVDYEGEIGVIIGRRASKVSAEAAMGFVWGYTLINDVTARDLQRDHKQWFIGKSLDTFCPLGPWAVSAEDVDITDLQLQTRINGEVRQDTNTAQLIFDVPTIIATLSAGLTLEPGDVIATGTPVGVGIGFDPPRYLVEGDEMVISAPGLGELRNTVGLLPTTPGLQRVGGRELFVERTGEGPAVVLVHGLGGTTDVYQPQLDALAEYRTVLRYDLSGHGRSPLAGPPTVAGWVDELVALLDAQRMDTVELVAHSMGTLVATHLAAAYPQRVSKLALLGAVRPQPEAAKAATRARAATVRADGMAAVVDAIVGAALSETTRTQRPLAVALVRELLLGQDPEGYAGACEALAVATEADLAAITVPVMLLTGEDDKVSPVATNDELFGIFPNAQLHVLPGVGHWHTVEDPDAVTHRLVDFLLKP